MIPAQFDYVAPESLDEALSALQVGGEDAKVLAGGHSLLPLMKLRLAAPSLLVDLRRVPGLSGIERENGDWRIGAMTTHYAVAEAGLGLASEVAGLIADPQVRYRGTIGGSLAHGDPASDMPAILLAADGAVTVRGESGEREVAASDLFQDFLTTAVADGEILTSVRLPALDGYGFGYEKFNRRKEDWAMVAVCALVKKGARRLVRGRADRSHAHGLDAAARDRRRAGAARPRARRPGHRGGRRAGRRGHRAAGRPERVGRLQAPPGARAVPARARAGVTMKLCGSRLRRT